LSVQSRVTELRKAAAVLSLATLALRLAPDVKADRPTDGAICEGTIHSVATSESFAPAYMPLVVRSAEVSVEPPSLEALDQVGGLAVALAVEADRAYVGAGPRVLILDVSNAESPLLVGRSQVLPGEVRDIALSPNGSHAFVVHGGYSSYPSERRGKAGLSVLDVSQPFAPSIVATLDGTSEWSDRWGDAGVHQIDFHRGHAYVAAGRGGVRILDVRDPTAPREVAAYATSGFVRDVQVVDRHAYVAAGTAGLRVLDVSDPSAPTEVGSVLWPEDMNLFVGDLHVSGEYVYVPASGYGVRVIDVADSTRPREAAVIELQGGSRPSPKGVIVADDTVYISYTTSWFGPPYSGIAVFDVSDPTAPEPVGDYFDELGAPERLTAAGSRLYAVREGLHVLDVTDRASPVVKGRFDVLPSVFGVESESGRAFVAAGWSGIGVVNVEQPDGATMVGWYDVDIDTEESGSFLGGHVVRDGIAYVIGIDGLHIVDVSDPSSPRVLGIHDPGSYSGATGIDVADGYAYIVGDFRLHVIDLHDPSSPREVGEYSSDVFLVDVHISGGRAYLVGPGALRILDLSDPTDPSPIGRWYPRGDLIDVHVVDRLAYVVGTNLEGQTHQLWVVDVSNPENPREISSCAGPFSDGYYSVAVDVSGSYAYWAAGDLDVIDVSDPASLRRAAVYRTPGLALDVAVDGDRVYVADWEGGLTILGTNLVDRRTADRRAADRRTLTEE